MAELQGQFAYDRFLQRLGARDDGWVLQGAAALLAREVSSRATREVSPTAAGPARTMRIDGIHRRDIDKPSSPVT